MLFNFMKKSFTCIWSLPDPDAFVLDLIAVHAYMAHKESKIFVPEVLIT